MFEFKFLIQEFAGIICRCFIWNSTRSFIWNPKLIHFVGSGLSSYFRIELSLSWLWIGSVMDQKWFICIGSSYFDQKLIRHTGSESGPEPACLIMSSKLVPDLKLMSNHAIWSKFPLGWFFLFLVTHHLLNYSRWIDKSSAVLGVSSLHSGSGWYTGRFHNHYYNKSIRYR